MDDVCFFNAAVHDSWLSKHGKIKSPDVIFALFNVYLEIEMRKNALQKLEKGEHVKKEKSVPS